MLRRKKWTSGVIREDKIRKEYLEKIWEVGDRKKGWMYAIESNTKRAGISEDDVRDRVWPMLRYKMDDPK